MLKRALPVVALILVLAPLEAQERLNADINARIRQEEASHSQILRTLHFLTDVYGPRLTGTPNHKAAAEWAIRQMESWGFTNGHLEPWDFGHPGWVNERFSAHITSPVKDRRRPAGSAGADPDVDRSMAGRLRRGLWQADRA